MTIEEKRTWLTASTLVTVYGWYFITVLGRVGDGPVEDIGYRGLLLVATIGVVAVLAAAHAILGLATALAPQDTSAHDGSIEHRGRSVGKGALAVGCIGAIGMALVGIAPFWIVNTLLAGLVVSELLAAGTRIALYRRSTAVSGGPS